MTKNFICLKVLSVSMALAILFYISIVIGHTMFAKKSPEPNHVFKMASNFNKAGATLDPATIVSHQEYDLIRNLYSRLVEYNSSGKLVPAVAESFFWKQNKLIFTFSNKVKTIDGHTIDAEDAAISLKRSILLKNTGHGDLRNFLCPNANLKSLNDNCDGIEVIKNDLVLTPISSQLGAHLLVMLESADFSIIPRSAINIDLTKPLLLNRRSTSGPYYLDRDNAHGNFSLKANHLHYLYSKDIPQTVDLVTTDADSAIRMVKKGEIDLIPTSMFLGGADAEPILAKKSGFSVHESLPIKVVMLCFSRKALQMYSAQHRFFVAAIISQYLNLNSRVTGTNQTIEFFQPLSDGSLSNEQKLEILKLRSENSHPSFSKPIELGVTAGFFKKLSEAFALHPEIKIVQTDIPAYEMSENERPDIYVVSNDSTWTEDVTLLSYNLQIGAFHLPQFNGDNWLKDYIKIEDREQRISKLQELHFDLLKVCAIYPIFVSPYFAVANPMWQLRFSTLGSGTELWQIRQKL